MSDEANPAPSGSVGFVDLVRQWPSYFLDSFVLSQAGDLRRAGLRARVLRAFDDRPAATGLARLLEALEAGRPWTLLVVDRVWARPLLARLRAAAGDPPVAVSHWESPAAWPEIGWRVAPLSRRALTALATGLARGAPPSPAEVPNLWRRREDGTWEAPAHAEPLEVRRELAEPLDLAHDLVEVLGHDPGDASDTRYLALNMGCPYRGAANPSGFLDGLALPTAWGDRGCTFCNVGPYERQTAAERRDLMARQLEALARHGAYRRLVVQDEYVFRDLDVLVEEVLRHGPPGVEILVRARVDYLETCREPLERALARLGDHGVLVPYLIGFESFSDAELARYNKGQTAQEAEQAVRTLDALAARHANLRVSPSQGFILFGPWTTLDDLRANLAAFRRLGFRRLRGGLTRSKLRLNPDAALVARARADGLVAATHARPDEDNAAETGYQAEIPWRFQHASTARVWELLNGPQPVRGEDEVDRLARALAQVEAEEGAARPTEAP